MSLESYLKKEANKALKKEVKKAINNSGNTNNTYSDSQYFSKSNPEYKPFKRVITALLWIIFLPPLGSLIVFIRALITRNKKDHPVYSLKPVYKSDKRYKTGVREVGKKWVVTGKRDLSDDELLKNKKLSKIDFIVNGIFVIPFLIMTILSIFINVNSDNTLTSSDLCKYQKVEINTFNTKTNKQLSSKSIEGCFKKEIIDDVFGLNMIEISGDSTNNFKVLYYKEETEKLRFLDVTIEKNSLIRWRENKGHSILIKENSNIEITTENPKKNFKSIITIFK